MNINPDDPTFLAQFTQEMTDLRTSEQPYARIQIHPITAFALIIQIQVAARFPDNVPWSLDQAVAAGKELQSLFNPDSAIYQILEMGWNPEHDRKREISNRVQIITNAPTPPKFKDVDVEVLSVDDLPPERRENVQYIYDEVFGDEVFGRITEDLEVMGSEVWGPDEEEEGDD